MDMVNGERIDIVRYHEDIKEYIASALTPAKIKGLQYREEPNPDRPDKNDRYSIVVVDEENFLPAVGKQGKNVKLAVRLTTVNIDVKTVAQAAEEGIE
jgi:N utilization substance protein A